MNPTKAFLLNEMATAESLQEFFLAHRAMIRLNQLVAEAGLGVAGSPLTPTGFQGPAPRPVLNQQMDGSLQGRRVPVSQVTPQGPRPFREGETAPDYDSQQFPWEQEQGF